MTAADRIRSVAERHELAWIAVDRLLGALIFLGAVVALGALVVAVTACQPSASTGYFGSCPAGNQVLQTTAPGVYKCVNQ